jgi:DNA-binding NarL/FixJ family response regulator
MTDDRTHSIMIVDDHAIVRSGLAMLLQGEEDLVLVDQAASIPEAKDKLATREPDVALVDITLKDENGLDLVRHVKEHHPSVKVIILSMHDESAYAERALRVGAAGYVMKENADDVVVEAIRTVLEGRVYLSPDISSRILLAMARGDGEADKPTSGVASLTDREQDVFTAIGRGMATRAIAESLGLSARTVEVHRANIKRKLGCDTAAQVVREAVRFVEQGGG